MSQFTFVTLTVTLQTFGHKVSVFTSVGTEQRLSFKSTDLLPSLCFCEVNLAFMINKWPTIQKIL